VISVQSQLRDHRYRGRVRGMSHSAKDHGYIP
jgi:hypothetical protein